MHLLLAEIDMETPTRHMEMGWDEGSVGTCSRNNFELFEGHQKVFRCFRSCTFSWELGRGEGNSKGFSEVALKFSRSSEATKCDFDIEIK